MAMVMSVGVQPFGHVCWRLDSWHGSLGSTRMHHGVNVKPIPQRSREMRDEDTPWVIRFDSIVGVNGGSVPVNLIYRTIL